MDQLLLQQKIEGVLFAWGDALSYQKLAATVNEDITSVKSAIAEMNKRYANHHHGIHIIEVNQSVQLATKAELKSTIGILFKSDYAKGLSKSMLEVLSIVAYKQPVTKIDIESIRGVKSDRSVQQLIELNFIEIAGQLEKIGRPNLYRTTEFFLKKFGLKTIRELPPIESFERLQISIDDGENDYAERPE